MHGAIRAGDPVAFRALYQAHHNVVYAHAYRVTGDWAASEDIVSLTFLEAWRLRERLRDEGETPLPWLMGIAINVLRNRSRAARRHRHAMARSPARDDVPDIADAVVTRIDDGERLAAARAALSRLRRTDREIFLLCVCSELTYAEAAHALDLPVGTVRSRLSRARVRLRVLAEEELRSMRAPFVPRAAIAVHPAPVPTILVEPTR
ncbi:RNA polymerase sigma factor [Embleya sp. NBC_00896]|uniref:RNA polymerase sigma factor n=1 Tax=Embleya sp. NBC_00896 TaxID=2975961 RepID=UPI00386BFCEF|nr:RNA polymerase sigma factor [Embleya sp. NBC_00896]